MSTLSHRGTHCGCPNCLAGQRERMIDRLTRDSLNIAVRHAQEQPESHGFEARRPAFPDLPTSLPGNPCKPFSLQWTEPVQIRAIPAPNYTGTDGPPASFMRLFDSPGQNLIYAVMRKGTVYPLYVGMVPGARATMRQRLDRHVRGLGIGSETSITRALHNELRDRGRDLYLALATYNAPGYRTNPNMTRVIEGMVQERTRPRFWTPDTWTFEDEEEEAELAELLEGEL